MQIIIFFNENYHRLTILVQKTKHIYN